MDQSKYFKNIVTRTKEYTPEQLKQIEKMKRDHRISSTIGNERLLWMDNSMVPGASMYMECLWLWEGRTKSGFMEEPHMHDFPEVIGFISTDRNNPRDLGAIMEMNLGDETHYLTQSCLMFIPPGMKHCPLTFVEVRRPVFFFTMAPISNYGRTSGLKNPEALKKSSFVPPTSVDASGTLYGRYIFTEPRTHSPSRKQAEAPKPPKTAETFHVVSLDGEATPGGFYVDFVWIYNGSMSFSQPHSHNFDEMIGFIGGGSRENPRAIDGDVSIAIGGERHQLTTTALAFIPGGLEHCPIDFKHIQKPVLCFTIGNVQNWDLAYKD